MNFGDPKLLLFAFAIVGTFLSWVRQRVAGNVVGNPVDYLISHPWHTVSMFGATFAACAGVVVMGQLDGASAFTAAMLGLGTGYTADSVINRGPSP